MANKVFDAEAMIKQSFRIPAVAFNNASPLAMANMEYTASKKAVQKYGGKGISTHGMRGIKDYAADNFWSIDGMKVAQLVQAAAAPRLGSSERKFVMKELNKVNAARQKAGIAQIEIPGAYKPDIPAPVSLGTPGDPQSSAIESQIKGTLDAILGVMSTPSKSVTEDDLMYKNRADEVKQLRLRGILQSAARQPTMAVVASTMPKGPSLGGY